jgi:hypothetical protein
MPAVLALPAKAALAGFLGLGFAAANTAANMFIVEVRPREEWDARIGARRRSVGWARSPDCRHSGSASRRGNISRVFLGYGVCRKSRFGDQIRRLIPALLFSLAVNPRDIGVKPTNVFH